MEENRVADIPFEAFCDGKFRKIDFPTHITILGKTGSGKSYLASKLIDSVENLFQKSGISNILVVLSPHEDVEEIMRKKLGDRWTIIHFTVNAFNQETIDRMLLYLDENKILGREVFVLIDDLAIQIHKASSTNLFLIKTFAVLRHHNISLFITVQNATPIIMDIIQNCSLVFIMQSFGSFATMTKIIRFFVGLINVPNLLRKIYPLLESNEKGAYICINLSHDADKNRQFTISNNISGNVGFTKRYLQMLSMNT